jgi:hypothetical protein
MTLILLIVAIGLSLSLLLAGCGLRRRTSIITLARVKYAAKNPTGKLKEQF